MHGSQAYTSRVILAPEEELLALGRSQAAMVHYLDHGRVHTGDTRDTVEAAHEAWAADQRAGLSCPLLAATQDTVRDLNQRAPGIASTPPNNRAEARYLAIPRSAGLVSTTR